jgi:hypothetical protein
MSRCHCLSDACVLLWQRGDAGQKGRLGGVLAKEGVWPRERCSGMSERDAGESGQRETMVRRGEMESECDC